MGANTRAKADCPCGRGKYRADHGRGMCPKCVAERTCGMCDRFFDRPASDRSFRCEDCARTLRWIAESHAGECRLPADGIDDRIRRLADKAARKEPLTLD